MKLDELKNGLKGAIQCCNSKSAYDRLSEFQKSGGEQFDAYESLKELRSTSQLSEELILELLDVVSGWCGSNRRIWQYELGSRVCLYTVDGYELKDHLRALLPGVAPSRIREYRLEWIKPGIELELRYPNNTTNTTSIANYYLGTASNSEGTFDVHKAPAIVCVAESVYVPIGTQLWCVRWP